MATTALPLPPTTEVQIVRVVKALFDAAPGYTYLTAFKEFANANGGVAALANALVGYTGKSGEALADLIVANLKLTGDAATAGKAFLATLFAQPQANVGQIIVDAMNALAGLGNDPTYGAAANAFNTSVAQAYAYSTNTANTTTDLATLQQADEVQQPVINQSITLTNSPDIATGTSGDDIFNGVRNENGVATFHSFDKLDGGDGTDTLIAQGIGTLATNPTTLKNIEKLHLVGAGAATGTKTLNLTNTTGVTHITSEAPLGNYTVADIGSGIQRIDLIAPAGTSHTFTFQSGAVGGSADSLTLGLQSLGAGTTRKVNLNPDSGTNGFETLNIELSGGASGKEGKFVTIDDGAATTLATVNVSGSANGALNLAAMGTAITVDASKATGNLVLKLDYAKDIKVTGGSGGDEFQFGNTLNTKDTVAGGDGTDTLAANGAQFANFTATASNISGIERIRIQDSAAANIDVSLFGVNYVRVNDHTGALTLNNLPSGSTVRFDDDAPAGTTLTIANAANGKADTISLDLRAAAGVSGNVTATINDVETIKVTTEDAKNPVVLNLTANDAANKGHALTVNLTGDNALTFTLKSSHANNTVDGSAMQANLDANLTDVTPGQATLKGGAGADTLTGSAGADTLTGNGGKDKFVFNNFGNADTITDFSTAVDDLYIDAKSVLFTIAPNGIKVAMTGTAMMPSALHIWNTMGTNAAMLTTGLLTMPGGASNTIKGAVPFKASHLFIAMSKAALTMAITMALAAVPTTAGGAGKDDRGVAFGKVGNTLYLVYVGDMMTGAGTGTFISAIRTIAKVGAGFTAADLFIY